ncbi:MAG: FAD:protein FMN transferase [SAR324 cluster bacterium]|nr:FAD:protein FMN transferase [SAR324 cluster bacterium]
MAGTRSTRRTVGPGRKSAALLLAGALSLILADALGAQGFRTRMRFQMGSLTEITVPDGQYSAQSVSRAFDVVDRLDRLLSTYKADSEVSRLAALGKLRVSPETMEIAEASLRLARITGGAFNPMLGPVIALWRQAEELGRLPSPEALEAARTLADFERVELDRAAGTIAFPVRGMGLNFGAIGKGFAVDKAAASLQRDGIRMALVTSGTSSHRLIGRPRGGACWELGIRHPGDAERAVTVLRLGPGGLATSAQSGRPREIGGRIYGHIVDPRTGRPAEPRSPVWSASVLAPTATDADALATALIVMEAADGMALVESLPRVEALLVRRNPDGSPRLVWSSGLTQRGTLDGLPLIVPVTEIGCMDGGASSGPAGAAGEQALRAQPKTQTGRPPPPALNRW